MTTEFNGRTQAAILDTVQVLIQEGQLDNALEKLHDYRETLTSDQIDFDRMNDLYGKIGVAFFESGNAQKATKAYQQIYYTRSTPELLLNMASAYALTGNLDKAECFLDDLRIKQPDNFKVLKNLLQIYIQTGRVEEADDLLKDMPETHLKDLEIQFLISSLHLLKGKHTEAIQLLENMIQQQPEEPRYRFNYGLACYMAGFGQKAVEALQSFWNHNPVQASGFIFGNAQALFKRIQMLAEHNRRLRASIEEPTLIGISPIMKELRRRLRKIQIKDVTVLLQGETGTGKEVFAREIHAGSPRKDMPLVSLNVATIPKELLESELFGHKKGSYTNAHEDRIGLFQAANGGTLFLDEIAEMSLEAQAKVLRALEERKIRRIGENEEIEIDVRLIVATKKNLREEVKAGRFREDLYYRLNVVTLELPPLRERPEDIPLFAEAFLDRSARKHHVDTAGFTSETIEMFENYAWPGNVREMLNLIESIVVQTEGDRITPDDLPDYISENSDKTRVKEALEEAKWNVTKAAEIYGIRRESFSRKMKRLGISKT